MVKQAKHKYVKLRTLCGCEKMLMVPLDFDHRDLVLPVIVPLINYPDGDAAPDLRTRRFECHGFRENGFDLYREKP